MRLWSTGFSAPFFRTCPCQTKSTAGNNNITGLVRPWHKKSIQPHSVRPRLVLDPAGQNSQDQGRIESVAFSFQHSAHIIPSIIFMSPSMSPDGTNPADGFGDMTSAIHVDDNPNAGIPRQKRLACLICRRRKLKCDGRRPSCSTCSRLGHPCAYDEVRKKSGPKRGYVKALEERLSMCHPEQRPRSEERTAFVAAADIAHQNKSR